jgi:diguanylate cyclase (GGDEF)-like protein
LTNLFDKLTGVLNQGTYLRKIKELKVQQIVIILDVDDFKYINDNYGHQYGDKCLGIISQAIKSIFGNYGQCYRIGGDEFAVILRKYSNVESLITRFEKTIADKFKSLPYQLSVSLGYSKYGKNDSIETVIQRADFNMYNAKKQKKTLKVDE